MKSFIDWLKILNPANLLLIKKIIDLLTELVQLIEELFVNPADDEKDK